MQQVKGSVINSMLLGRNHFCCLCFKTVPDSAVHIEDNIIIRKQNKTFVEIYMIDILARILGPEIYDQLSIFNAVCNQCSSEAIKSYKFLTKCKENARKLGQIIDGLTNGTEICRSNSKGTKAGFISINTENFEYKGYNSTLTFSTSAAAYQKYRALKEKEEPKNKPAVIRKPKPIQIVKHKVLRLRLARLNPKVLNMHTVFVCPICDKYFVRKNSMHLHYKKKHRPTNKSEMEDFHFIPSQHNIKTDEKYVYVNVPANSADPLMLNVSHSNVLKVEPGENGLVDHSLLRHYFKQNMNNIHRKVPTILKRRSMILPKKT